MFKSTPILGILIQTHTIRGIIMDLEKFIAAHLIQDQEGCTSSKPHPHFVAIPEYKGFFSLGNGHRRSNHGNDERMANSFH